MKVSAPICGYCNNVSKLVGGRKIYPHRADLHHLQFWLCEDCDAYVGCHRDTTVPKGSLADPDLRCIRRQTHDSFDFFWKNGLMARSECYDRLCKDLNIQKGRCHIGMFDIETCERVIKICEENWINE